MREIEFRGKRFDNGEWVYGCLVDNLFGNYKTKKKSSEIINPDFNPDYDCWDDLLYDCIIEVHTETVGQYTGLKDKNGTKIFEGDIVLRCNKDKIGEVSYFEGSFIFDIAITANSLINFNTPKYCEIIGNIHETKN